MRIVEKETFLIPYTFIKLAKKLRFEDWSKQISKTATKPELWNRIVYTELRQIKIFDTSHGTFSTNSGRVLDTQEDGAVVVSHSDRDLLDRIDYH